MRLVLILVLITQLGCVKDPILGGKDLIGTWQLIEVFSDPGDGSGSYHPAAENKQIKFTKTGTVQSEGDVCFFDPRKGAIKRNNYEQTDKEVTFKNCAGGASTVPFELNEDILILQYTCIEPCKLKYKRLD